MFPNVYIHSHFTREPSHVSCLYWPGTRRRTRESGAPDPARSAPARRLCLVYGMYPSVESTVQLPRRPVCVTEDKEQQAGTSRGSQGSTACLPKRRDRPIRVRTRRLFETIMGFDR